MPDLRMFRKATSIMQIVLDDGDKYICIELTNNLDLYIHGSPQALLDFSEEVRRQCQP